MATRDFDSEEPAETASAGTVHFSAPFIKRPVATFLLSVAIILAGAVGYKLLPVSSLPEVEYPVISVGAGLPGADPETMASSVATPLERQFAKIAGINEMTSSSSTGSTSITMQFDLSRDVNGAARDVQAAINAAQSQLPANLPSQSDVPQDQSGGRADLILALTSDTLNVPQLYDACDSILAQKIAQVQAAWGRRSAAAARSRRCGSRRIRCCWRARASGSRRCGRRSATVNVNQPKGYLTNERSQRWSVSTTDQLFGAAAYAPLIIATDLGPVSSAAASTGLPASVASSVTSDADEWRERELSTGARGARRSASSGFDGQFCGERNRASTGVSRRRRRGDGLACRGAVWCGLQDVARVIDSVEDIHTGGLFNGKPAILVVVFKSPGANVIQTVDNVLAMLPTLQASIPPAIKDQRGARPDDDDSGVGEGCDADAGDLDPAGDPGGVCVSARGAIDADSERVGAAEPAGDVWA